MDPESPEDIRSRSPNLLKDLLPQRRPVKLENNIKTEPLNSVINFENLSPSFEDALNPFDTSNDIANNSTASTEILMNNNDENNLVTFIMDTATSSPEDIRSRSPNLLKDLLSQRRPVKLENNIKTEPLNSLINFENLSPSFENTADPCEISNSIAGDSTASTEIMINDHDDNNLASISSLCATPEELDEPRSNNIAEIGALICEANYPTSDEDSGPPSPVPQQPEPQYNNVGILIGRNADFRWLLGTNSKEEAIRKGEKLGEKMEHFRRDLQKKRFQAWEKIGMLWWLIKYDKINSSRTPVRWQEMIDDGYLTHRTKDSLLNTYLRFIIPCLEDYGMPEELSRTFRQDDLEFL